VDVGCIPEWKMVLPVELSRGLCRLLKRLRILQHAFKKISRRAEKKMTIDETRKRNK
jgi:hypothetical protein